jgi:hypothetical protein
MPRDPTQRGKVLDALSNVAHARSGARQTVPEPAASSRAPEPVDVDDDEGDVGDMFDVDPDALAELGADPTAELDGRDDREEQVQAQSSSRWCGLLATAWHARTRG